MARSSRPRLPSVLLALGGLLVAAGCAGADDGPRMVALGDSFAAGSGIATSRTECQRSDHNYPTLLAERLDMDLVDVSCGGATTSSVLTGRTRAGSAQRDPQIEALDDGADLVTLTIGANDGQVAAGLFQECFLPPRNTAQACADLAANAADELSTTRARVDEVLAEIAERAPRATVVVVGYLPLTPPTGCSDLPVAPAAVRTAAGVEGSIEEMLRGAAEAAGARFVSMRDAAPGHDACGSDPWVNGITAAEGDGVVLHPNAAGTRATTALVADALAERSG